MRGGKDEEKRLGPLFPRLHVNDADKGGPRAPPRNKMALYEQLSIPLQRFNASPTLPLPQRNGPGALVPSASLSQGGGHETSVFSSCYMTLVSAHSTKESHCRTSDGIDIDGTRAQRGQRSISHANDRSLDAAGCRSFHQPELSHGNKSSRKKFDEDAGDDDFMVPTFIHPGNAAYPVKDNPLQGTDELASMSAKSQQRSCFGESNFSILFPKSCDKSMGSSRPSGVKLRKVERGQGEQRPTETLEIKGHKKSAKQPGMGENLVGPSDFPKSSSKIDPSKTKNITDKSCHGSEVQFQESYVNGASDRPKSLIGIGSAESEDALGTENGSGSKALVGDIPQSTMATDNHKQEHNDDANGSPKLGEEERNSEVSESSMMDSISGLEILPDDVVQVIGLKHFWKARRALVNQQRVFAMQVFELHRLIKVQKLIAASPGILLEGSPFLSASPQKVPTKNVPKESFSKPQASTTCQEDDLQKPNQSIECPMERTVGPPPLPPQEDSVHGEPEVQNPRPSPCSENHLSVTVALDHKPSAWCFQPPANQWLVPVMLPFEGLVYKLYTGPCPPSSGFMAPVYGGVGPMCLPPVAGDLMNPVYGFSGGPSIDLNYFPAPYPVPIANPFFSASALEQVSPLAGSRPHGQSEQNSSNTSNPKSEVFSGVFSKFQASSMHRELHGSLVSNHSEEGQGEERDALSLFPTSLATEGLAQPSESCGKDNQARAIKVVPHNAQSAPESAARIFQSIQEERLQHDL